MALFSSSDPVYHPLPPEDRMSARHFPTSYASVNVRSMASVVDLLCIALMMYPSRFAMAFHPKAKEMAERVAALERDVLSGVYEKTPELLQQVQYDLFVDHSWNYLPVQLLCVLPMVILFLIGWRYFGTTPGKWLFGLRIVNAADGGPVSWGQCLKRAFIGYVISVPPLMLGIMWAHFNKRRRGWHDYIGDTVVIRCKSKYLRGLKKQRKSDNRTTKDAETPSSYVFDAAESDKKDI